MWDVVIGEGDKGNTAVKVFEIEGDHSIYHNNQAFWISNCVLDIEIVVFKDTREGRRIKNMILDGVPRESIEDYANRLAIENAGPRLILYRLKELEARAFERGREAKMKEIHEALGLNKMNLND